MVGLESMRLKRDYREADKYGKELRISIRLNQKVLKITIMGHRDPVPNSVYSAILPLFRLEISEIT